MRHDPLRVDGTLRASFLLGIEHVEEGNREAAGNAGTSKGTENPGSGPKAE